MKYLSFILIAVISISLLRSDIGVSERFPWLSDLEQARSLALSEQKPLLIVFRCEP